MLFGSEIGVGGNTFGKQVYRYCTGIVQRLDVLSTPGGVPHQSLYGSSLEASACRLFQCIPVLMLPLRS